MRTQAPSNEAEEVTPGPAACQSCHMLLTGGTGFLGSALIAALVENHPTATFTLLIRAKRGEEADTRLQKHIRKLFPDAQEAEAIKSRIFALEGRLDSPAFFESEPMLQLASTVTHIVHSAASVRFDNDLDDAFAINVYPTLLLHRFAATRCGPQLKSFVHVSTAFVQGARGGEPLPPRPVPPLPARTLQVLRPLLSPVMTTLQGSDHGSDDDGSDGFSLGARSEDDAVVITRSTWESIREHHANSYTFTKAVAERLLTEQHEQLRNFGFEVCIVRPSIISSAVDPGARGNESFAALNAVVAAVSCGYMHAVCSDRKTRLNVVPVDRVARVILGAGGLPTLHTQRDPPPLPSLPSGEVRVLHATCDKEHSVCSGELLDNNAKNSINYQAPGFWPGLRFYAKPTWAYYLIIFIMDMLPLWLMANFGAALGLPEKAVGAVKRTLEGLNSIHDRESGLSFFMREYFDYTPDEYSLSVGIVDYDPIAYLDTVGVATMEALQKKGVLKKYDTPPGFFRKLRMAFTILYSN